MLKTNVQRCVYCNKESKNLTQEHIIPRGFYKASNSKLKSGDLSVFACFKCNNRKSKLDEQFRNLMVKTCAHLSSEANALLPVVQRSISRNRKFQNEMNDENVETVFVPTFNDELIKIKDPGFDVFSYIKDIAMAIYNLETNQTLNVDSFIYKVKQFEPTAKQRFDPEAEWITIRGFNKRVLSQDKIFQYLFQVKNDDIVMLLSFFEFENFLVLFQKKT